MWHCRCRTIETADVADFRRLDGVQRIPALFEFIQWVGPQMNGYTAFPVAQIGLGKLVYRNLYPTVFG